MQGSRTLSWLFFTMGIASAMLIAFAGPGAQRSASADDVVFCDGYEATIVGSGTIRGTNRDDVIVGSDGPDVIDGRGGHDIICGEGDDDTIHGGAGDDWIWGDFAYCEAIGGNDTLYGDAGDDYIEDYCGINTGYGGSGSDSMAVVGTADGGSGNDAYVQAFGDTYLTCDGCFTGLALGGTGNDSSVYVYLGTADGGSGNDIVYAGATGDVAKGGSGNDYVGDLYDNAVTLNGGSGRDTCAPNRDDDTLISCERSPQP